jgi:hypothetical protein
MSALFYPSKNADDLPVLKGHWRHKKGPQSGPF